MGIKLSIKSIVLSLGNLYREKVNEIYNKDIVRMKLSVPDNVDKIGDNKFTANISSHDILEFHRPSLYSLFNYHYFYRYIVLFIYSF